MRMDGMEIFSYFSSQLVATRFPSCDKVRKRLQNVSHSGKKVLLIIIFW